MFVLRSVISASLIVSPFILLVLLTAPLADKRYASGGRCRVWLVLVAALFVPLVTVLPRPVFQIHMPVPVIAESAPVAADAQTLTLAPANNTIPSIQTNLAPINPDMQPNGQAAEPVNAPVRPNTPNSAPQIKPNGQADGMSLSVLANTVRAHLHILLPGLWLLGATISLLHRFGSYFLFVRSVNRWSTDVTDEDALALFGDVCADLGVRKKPGLRTFKKITSPMLMGCFKPLVLLPAADYAPDEMILLLRHELVHHKRRDLWVKLALVAATSVYWFHPLVHLMTAQAGKDLEAACDTLTVNGMDMHQRKRYSEIILSAAYKAQLRPHPMTNHFLGGKYMLKKRFSNIFDTAKKKGTALFAVTGAVILAVTLMVGFNFAEAKAAAKTPDVSDAYANDLSDYAEQVQKYADEYAKEAKKLSDEFYAGQYATDWDAYAEAMEAYAKEFEKQMEELNDAFDWEAYANQWEDYAQQFDWSSYSEQWEANWDAYAKAMEAYAEEMEALYSGLDWDDYATEMSDFQAWGEKANAQMQGNPDASSWTFLNNGTMHSLEELSALVYDQAKPMEQRFDNVTSLTLDLVSEAVKVTRGGDALTIRYPEWYEGNYAFVSSDDGKTLTMSMETGNRYLKKDNSTNGGWLQEVLRHKGIQTDIVIEIVIPESMPLDSLFIDNVSGQVDITDSIIGKFSLDSVSSRVTVTGGQIDTLDIDDVSGRHNIKGCALNTLDISTVSGKVDVQVTGKASDYDIMFDNMSGGLKVNGTEVKSARNKSAEKRISLDAVSGSLSVRDAD